MELNLGIVGPLRCAFDEQAKRAFIVSPSVENPPEGIGDLRIVWHQFLRGSGQCESLLLVSTVLGVEVGEVVRGWAEGRVFRHDRLICGLRLRNIPSRLLN